jgi:hypothetical protein
MKKMGFLGTTGAVLSIKEFNPYFKTFGYGTNL